MPSYIVDFNVRLFNATVTVEAEDEDAAASKIENMPLADLMKHFQFHDVDVECVMIDDADESEDSEDE